MRKLLIILLFLVFAVQLSVPAKMIFQQEDAIQAGTSYKFKTRPIDPLDPFRGKYISLNYELNSFETTEDWKEYRGPVFVYLGTDGHGFAKATAVSKTLLDTDQDYVKAESNYSYGNKVNFRLPFNRFYMNEHKAYDAEVSVRETQLDTTKTCYGLVYIKDGTAVLENVFIDDVPIQQFVDEFQNNK